MERIEAFSEKQWAYGCNNKCTERAQKEFLPSCTFFTEYEQKLHCAFSATINGKNIKSIENL